MTPSPTFTLRRITDQPHRTHAWRVMLDEIEVGGIGRTTDTGLSEFWTWQFWLLRPATGTQGKQMMVEVVSDLLIFFRVANR